MNVSIVSKEEKPLLCRTEIVANLSYKGKTPSKSEVRGAIASSVKADEKLVCVYKIEGEYGLESAKAVVYVYKNVKDKERFEPAEEEKKDTKPKAAEAPKEEPKVEDKPKEEEKKE